MAFLQQTQQLFNSTGAANASITGVAGTSDAGTLTASGTALRALTGVQATSAAGTVVAAGPASELVTGVGALVSTGALTPTGEAAGTLTGVAGTAAVGSPVAAGASLASLTGAGATAGQSTPTATGAASPALVGASSEITAGHITAGSGQSAEASVEGAGATASAGTVSANGGEAQSGGWTYVSRLDQDALTYSATVNLVGASARSVAGSPVAGATAIVQIAGVQMRAEFGSVDAVGMSRVFARERVSPMGARGLVVSLKVTKARKRGAWRRAEKLMRMTNGSK